jgi:hypothetical protein
VTRTPRTGAILVALGSALLLAAGPARGQDLPPDAAWVTFDTDHFRVIYHPGLEDLARHAAAVAEETHAVLRDELRRVPRGRIELVVTDHVDFSNGLATPFTTNRIVVFARPPVEAPGLAFSRDWLELVVAHELVHIFHLDPAGAVGRALRSVFGRVPMLWPLFPALGTPVWNIEGLATYYESRLTGAGRAHGTYHDMVIRTTALETGIPPLRRVSAPSPVWPGGERSYIYGAALMAWITAQYGADAHRALLDATYGSVLPTFLFVDQIARRALGRSFTDLYDEWRAAATDSAHALRDRLTAQELTPTEIVVAHGPYAVAPRVSPDGGRLSYAVHDYRSDPAIRVLDLATGLGERVARHHQFGNLLGPASWLPDGSAMVLAQLEYHRRYRIHGDLWLVALDGTQRRLTRNQRLTSPDVAPDGRRVAAVQNHHGSVRLVEYDLATDELRVLADAAPGEAFDAPRWSPDGRRLAVTRYAGGRVNVVVVDAATSAIAPLTDDEALAGAPAWSPDGRWVVFWSDRTGIPNLFAAPAPGADGDAGPAAADGSLWQVTNLVTGAFEPDVSPDGTTLYFVAYHHHGWRVERTAFDPAAWRPAMPPAVFYADGLLTKAPAGSAGSPAPELRPLVSGPARRYSGLAGARPRFWAPTYAEVGNTVAGQWSRFVGVSTFAWDVVQRHTWTGSAAYDIDTGRLAGGTTWTWAGLGNPDLTFSARRAWSGAGRLQFDDGSAEAVLEREDRIAVDALFWQRRWRRSAWLGVGSELRFEEFQAIRLSDEELARAGFRFAELPTLASLAVRPGVSTVRQHPYSISRQDGVTLSGGAGRWWNVSDGRRAYDQILGSAAAYSGHQLWGFADHVTAVRIAAIRRTGDDARTASIGGAPGGMPDLLPGIGYPGYFLPVRGFQSGDRFGTRAWAASAEYRFPIHMSGHPGHVLGLSITSVAGSIFADAGHAWCSDQERESDQFRNCPARDATPLAAAGAELVLNLGVIHSIPLSLRYGFALPLSGTARRRIVLHAAAGPSF